MFFFSLLLLFYFMHFIIWSFFPFLFSSGFSFADTDDSQDSMRGDGTIFYSTLPLPSAHKLSDNLAFDHFAFLL